MTTATSQPRRTRITVDLTPELRREIRVAAARRDISMTQYVTEVLEERLAEEDAVRDEEK